MSATGLVHIVYAPYGLDAFRQFLASYRQHPAGADHELVLLCKGFGEGKTFEPYGELLAGISHRLLTVPDSGFDLGSYFFAARHCEHRWLCFLNSRSTIAADDWLAKMQQHLEPAEVGLVGTLGNYESFYSNVLSAARFSRHRWLIRRLYFNTRTFLELEYMRHRFEAFPNPHIRTNGFMLARETMLALRRPALRTKMDCYQFESGRNSLTRQVLRRGKKCLVVGRDGQAYGLERLRESATFRSGGQRNALIEDNQTRDYAGADAAGQRLLEQYAWGSPER